MVAFALTLAMSFTSIFSLGDIITGPTGCNGEPINDYPCLPFYVYQHYVDPIVAPIIRSSPVRF